MFRSVHFISDYLYISKREKCVLDRDIFYIARGFLLREISMIVSSVDNGRTFYDYERKWANFHRGDTIRADRFTPHFYLLCRRKSARSHLYTSRFASFRARSTESNKSVATFIYTRRVAIKIVTFLFSVNPGSGLSAIRVYETSWFASRETKIAFSLISWSKISPMKDLNKRDYTIPHLYDD